MAVKLADHVEIFDLDEGAILLNHTSGVYFQINATALRVLREIDAKKSLKAIAQALAAETGVDATVVFADVSMLAEHLRSQKILVDARP